MSKKTVGKFLQLENIRPYTFNTTAKQSARWLDIFIFIYRRAVQSVLTGQPTWSWLQGQKCCFNPFFFTDRKILLLCRKTTICRQPASGKQRTAKHRAASVFDYRVNPVFFFLSVCFLFYFLYSFLQSPPGSNNKSLDMVYSKFCRFPKYPHIYCKKEQTSDLFKPAVMSFDCGTLSPTNIR